MFVQNMGLTWKNERHTRKKKLEETEQCSNKYLEEQDINKRTKKTKKSTQQTQTKAHETMANVRYIRGKKTRSSRKKREREKVEQIWVVHCQIGVIWLFPCIRVQNIVRIRFNERFVFKIPTINIEGCPSPFWIQNKSVNKKRTRNEVKISENLVCRRLIIHTPTTPRCCCYWFFCFSLHSTYLPISDKLSTWLSIISFERFYISKKEIVTTLKMDLMIQNVWYVCATGSEILSVPPNMGVRKKSNGYDIIPAYFSNNKKGK